MNQSEWTSCQDADPLTMSNWIGRSDFSAAAGRGIHLLFVSYHPVKYAFGQCGPVWLGGLGMSGYYYPALCLWQRGGVSQRAAVVARGTVRTAWLSRGASSRGRGSETSS